MNGFITLTQRQFATWGEQSEETGDAVLDKILEKSRPAGQAKPTVDGPMTFRITSIDGFGAYYRHDTQCYDGTELLAGNRVFWVAEEPEEVELRMEEPRQWALEREAQIEKNRQFSERLGRQLDEERNRQIETLNPSN